MRTKLMLLGVGAVLAAGGCAEDAAPGGAALSTTNPHVTVDVLLEVDGYRVYRFEDAGHFHYFVTPEGIVTDARTESCGKNCTRTEVEDVQTVVRDKTTPNSAVQP